MTRALGTELQPWLDFAAVLTVQALAMGTLWAVGLLG